MKEVEDYQRFGVVVTDKDGYMTKIIEKPSTPISKRANIGLYYIRNWKLLYEGIAYVMKQPANKGEYYLTDAFQYMIDKGAKIKVVDVEGWYDAGKLDTLLETNREMLKRGARTAPGNGARGLDDHRSGVHRGRRDAHEVDGRTERVAARRRGDRALDAARHDRGEQVEDHGLEPARIDGRGRGGAGGSDGAGDDRR